MLSSFSNTRERERETDGRWLSGVSGQVLRILSAPVGLLFVLKTKADRC